jgi:hypothetical protein
LHGNLSITVGMEPTACLKARVLDGNDKPLKDATVSLWPNARYGEWSAVVLGSDCYNTVDSLSSDFKRSWENPFSAKTDTDGLAVIPNLPVEANSLNVDHPQWAMPLASTGFPGQQRREQPRGAPTHLAVVCAAPMTCPSVKWDRHAHPPICETFDGLLEGLPGSVTVSKHEIITLRAFEP